MSKSVNATIKLFNAEGKCLAYKRSDTRRYKLVLDDWKETYPAFSTYYYHIIPDTGEETIIKKAA